jgi:hypothetical protein
LRDWLQLLLVLLVFPALLIPAMLEFVLGEVAGRVEATPTAAIAHPRREPPASAPGPALSSSGGIVNAEGGADQPVRRARLDGSTVARIVLVDVSRRRHGGYIHEFKAEAGDPLQ